MTKNATHRLTVLTTLGGIRAVKTFGPGGKELESYGRAKKFTHREITIDDSGDWLRELASESQSFVVLGEVIDKSKKIIRRLSTQRDGADATLKDVPRSWMPLDIDQIDIDFGLICDTHDIETIANQTLRRLEIPGIECVAHLSNSHGFNGKYRIRLWGRLAKPATAAQMKEFWRERWAGEDFKVDVAGKMKPIVDSAVFQAQQPIYTGDPILEGVASPVKDRVALIRGRPIELKVAKSKSKSKKGAPEDDNIALLKEAGLYIRRLKPGQHCIDCPWEDGHTPGDRPDDTFYFEPHHNGHDIPAFKCHHGSCEERKWSDVLEFMGERVPEAQRRSSPAESRHDWGNAERLAAQAKDDVRYEPRQRTFYSWDATRWRMDDGAHTVSKLAVHSAQQLLDDAIACPDSARKKQLLDWYRTSLNENKIKGAVELLKNFTELHVRAAQLDADPFLLGVANGALDLRNGELRPPDREHLITKVTGCEFDAKARCPQWLRFLDTVMGGDAAMIAYLQDLAGYTLSGDTSGQMLMFLYGTGQNGKSVFIEVIRDLLGDYGMSMRTEALSLKAMASKNGPSEDIARLMGARMVTVNETAEGMRFDEALVKDLTGEDTVAARHLHKGTFEYRPAFKIWIRGNHQPEFNGADGGMARRVRLIPFDVRIDDAEKDPQLKLKLRAELPGILNWAIEGCLRWQKAGSIETPKKVLDATKDYLEDMDGLAEFFESVLISDKKSWTPVLEIFKAYQQWASFREGIRMPLTKHKLGLRLKGRGFKATNDRVKGKRVRGYAGVRVRGAFSSVESDQEGLI